MKGQPDKKNVIKLTSQILSVLWQTPQATVGGNVNLIVELHNVGDASQVSVSLIDASGKNVGSAKGKVAKNKSIIAIVVPDTAKEKLFAIAKLSDHKLELSSSPLVVIPRIQIRDVQIWDGENKQKLDYIPDGEACILKAKVDGVSDQAMVDWSVRIRMPAGASTIAKSGKSTLKQAAFEQDFQWTFGSRNQKIKAKEERDKYGEGYENPQAELVISLLGATAVSAAIPIKQCMILRYQVAKGQAGPFEGKKITIKDPSGKEESRTIPANGEIRVEQTQPGTYEIDDSDLKDIK